MTGAARYWLRTVFGLPFWGMFLLLLVAAVAVVAWVLVGCAVRHTQLAVTPTHCEAIEVDGKSGKWCWSCETCPLSGRCWILEPHGPKALEFVSCLTHR
jgi:hypothetical protein